MRGEKPLNDKVGKENDKKGEEREERDSPREERTRSLEKDSNEKEASPGKNFSPFLEVNVKQEEEEEVVGEESNAISQSPGELYCYTTFQLPVDTGGGGEGGRLNKGFSVEKIRKL